MNEMLVEPTFRDMLNTVNNIRANGISGANEEYIVNLIEEILKRLILLEIEK